MHSSGLWGIFKDRLEMVFHADDDPSFLSTPIKEPLIMIDEFARVVVVEDKASVAALHKGVMYLLGNKKSRKTKQMKLKRIIIRVKSRRKLNYGDISFLYSAV